MVDENSLYHFTQEANQRMLEKNTAYPVVNHIYKEKEIEGDTKFVRLCDESEVLDEPPEWFKPIPDGWDDYSKLGFAHSCSDCAERSGLT